MQSDGAAGDSASSAATTQHVLRSWLESTLSEPKSGLTDREWQVLRDTMAAAPAANENPTESLTACAERLVLAFLKLRFPAVSEADGRLQRMGARIVQTLCSDPTARRRLAEFQQLLQRPQS